MKTSTRLCSHHIFKRQINRSRLVYLLTLTAILTSCQGLQRRSDVQHEHETPVKTAPVKNASGAPGSSESAAPTQAQTPKAESPVVPATPTPPPAEATPNTETFLKKKAPTVGLILGPGLMKTYAHIGVLKEFTRARIPIQSVVGLEWGALMAGLYAMQGQANEVEWKTLKLKEDDLPSGGLLSSTVKPASISSMKDFFNTVFNGQLFERNRVDFACPTYSFTTEKMIWVNRGGMKEAMTNCLAFPPYFKDNSGWIASPAAIEEAATYLKSRGVTYIVFVNVLGGEVNIRSGQEKNLTEQVLWSEIKRELNRSRVANSVITINTAEYPLMDLDARRNLVELGAKGSRETVNKLIQQYGF